ncbi:MAG: isoprenylcysteine carboxylmethyltransferase family protein [Polyangiaceae bacterium]
MKAQMESPTLSNSPSEQSGDARGVLRRALQLLASGAILAASMFVPAGTLSWWQAWAFLGIYFGAILVNALFVLRADSGLIAERGRTAENTKSWDRVITGVLTLLTIALLATGGLDKRFGWSHVSLPVSVFGLALIVFGEAIVGWAMSANRYFSRVVRIQNDRGHQVCSSGPYHHVRHPGYTGMILYSIAMSFGLGSWCALGPALLVAITFVVRTVLEDRTLQAELPGYREYASRVRYRLVPGVW